MKKFFALLLTLAMVLSLAACGGKKEEAPAEETKEPEQTETQESAESAVTTVTAGKLTVAVVVAGKFGDRGYQPRLCSL